MAKVSGKSGYVAIGATASRVIGINQWALDYTVDMLETTDFSASGVAAYIPGVSRWSGTFSGFKDGAPQTLGTANSVSIFLAEDANTNWSGVAFLAGIHPANNHDGIISYAYDIQGTGVLTVASA